MPHIHVILNGEDRTIPQSLNIAQALEYLSIDSRRVAVEVNRCIIGRREWDRVQLQDGDVVEVVQFVGGG